MARSEWPYSLVNMCSAHRCHLRRDVTVQDFSETYYLWESIIFPSQRRRTGKQKKQLWPEPKWFLVSSTFIVCSRLDIFWLPSLFIYFLYELSSVVGETLFFSLFLTQIFLFVSSCTVKLDWCLDFLFFKINLWTEPTASYSYCIQVQTLASPHRFSELDKNPFCRRHAPQLQPELQQLRAAITTP